MNQTLDQFELEVQSDEATANLDPLGLDNFLIRELPDLNNKRESQTILSVANSLPFSPDHLLGFSRIEARAATRDLGMIAASLAKHDIGLKGAPLLEQSLARLSHITDEVPRDTVFSYGTRNPQNWRMRTFTATQAETEFIGSFANGMKRLPYCIHKLLSAMRLSVFDLRFSDLLGSARTDLTELVNGMANVRRNVTPTFFTTVLRPYFPPLTINQKTYVAPGGAQMILLLVDRILWGAGITHPTYRAYFEDNLQYLPLYYRNIDNRLGNQSLVDKFLSEASDNLTEINCARQALDSILLEIIRFRIPHRKTARENFQLRIQNAVGSGGYTEDILDILLVETKTARKRISEGS